ncbi:IS3 family transposase [Mucilaginibacter sp.]|uniref:IS3 family transposase n=1 Tax=Mucilaginibacter sp. TaxID=1882438 RepID=UPI003B00F45A
MVYHRSFSTKAVAKLAVFEYIEVWYNRRRRHSALNYITSCQYEKLLLNNKMSA